MSERKKKIVKIVNIGKTKYVSIGKLLPKNWNEDFVEAEVSGNQIVLSNYEREKSGSRKAHSKMSSV